MPPMTKRNDPSLLIFWLPLPLFALSSSCLQSKLKFYWSSSKTMSFWRKNEQIPLENRVWEKKVCFCAAVETVFNYNLERDGSSAIAFTSYVQIWEPMNHALNNHNYFLRSLSLVCIYIKTPMSLCLPWQFSFCWWLVMFNNGRQNDVITFCVSEPQVY